MTEQSIEDEIREIRTEAEHIDSSRQDDMSAPKSQDSENGNDVDHILENLRRENDTLKEQLKDAGQDVAQSLLRDRAELENEVRAHPLQSILIAGLAGFVAASIFSRPGRF